MEQACDRYNSEEQRCHGGVPGVGGGGHHHSGTDGSGGEGIGLYRTRMMEWLVKYNILGFIVTEHIINTKFIVIVLTN